MFYPFLNYFNRGRVRTVDNFGIPVLRTNVDNEPARENDKILELQKEVSELKNIIRKANQMVPPPMKEMLPQDMKNAMDKVGQ